MYCSTQPSSRPTAPQIVPYSSACVSSNHSRYDSSPTYRSTYESGSLSGSTNGAVPAAGPAAGAPPSATAGASGAAPYAAKTCSPEHAAPVWTVLEMLCTLRPSMASALTDSRPSA